MIVIIKDEIFKEFNKLKPDWLADNPYQILIDFIHKYTDVLTFNEVSELLDKWGLIISIQERGN